MGTDGKMTGKAGGPDALQGLRVLVVEDEIAIAMLLEDMLADFGCEVVGPVARLAPALAIARSDALDCAILDVNVAGEPVYPVVDALNARKVPLVFSTGYGQSGIDGPYRDRPVLPKPFAQADLERAIREAVEGQARGAPAVL